MERVKKIIQIIILGFYGVALQLPVIIAIFFITSMSIERFILIINSGWELNDIFSYVLPSYSEILRTFKMLLNYYIPLLFILFSANICVFYIIYDIVAIFIVLFE